MAKRAHKQSTQPAGLSKRTAIYIRVSSERQADLDRISPQTQEADCRAYCLSHGYSVVEVYSDTERYRAGRRMVEPSGTRADRPGLKRLLADARAGRFDLIVAWREDRLYRSYRPMLDVLECLEEANVQIELVKEHFDPSIAPIKAWVARMELVAKHDRLMMGAAGRLTKGKVWKATVPYGYRMTADGYLEINSEQAEWVRRIFEWYASGLSFFTIRRRLVEGGAVQQRRKKDSQASPWTKSVVFRILRRSCYWTGRLSFEFEGKRFEVPTPLIVDEHIAQRADERRISSKFHPARNVKYDYLCMGLIYCAVCNRKLAANTCTHRKGVLLKTPFAYYRCPRHNEYGDAPPGCCHRINIHKADAALWAKVWALLTKPGEFEALLAARIGVLQAQEIDAKTETEKLERQLDDLLLKRQQVMTWALDKVITQQDLELRLAGMTVEQSELERQLNDARLLVGDQAGRLIEAMRLYREQAAVGLEGLNDTPLNEEDARRQFELRRKWVLALVKRINVLADKTIQVNTELDLSEVAQAVQVRAQSTSRREPITG